MAIEEIFFPEETVAGGETRVIEGLEKRALYSTIL